MKRCNKIVIDQTFQQAGYDEMGHEAYLPAYMEVKRRIESQITMSQVMTMIKDQITRIVYMRGRDEIVQKDRQESVLQTSRSRRKKIKAGT